MTNVSSVLVTGATGGVGRSICTALLREGIQVRVFLLPDDDGASLSLPSDAVFRGRVEDAGSVEPAITGVDAVVHCAAILPNRPGVSATEYLNVNRGGTENVLASALRHQVKVGIFFSTISVVDHNSALIDRARICDYTEPTDPYLASKIAAEQSVLRARDRFPGQLAVIRPGFVYGPKAFGVWHEPLRLVMRGQMVLIDGGRVSLPLAYADDIAEYVVMLLRGKRYEPPYDIHVVANPEPTTMAGVFNFIAEYLGAPRPRSAPGWPLAIGASINELLPRIMKVGPLAMLTKARVRQYSRGYDLSGVLDHPALDHVRMTNFRVGLSRMLDEYMAQQNRF
jgi:nucleoside-diphosphate-sugar epimerase